jgi:hypothetical protein
MGQNKKLIIISILLFFIASLFIAIKIFPNTLIKTEDGIILEKEDIQFLKIEQRTGVPMELHITGLVFHSSLAVGKIDVNQLNDTLQIMIHLKLVTPGSSGNIDYNLIVPKIIRKVVLGKEGAVIWERR